MLCLRHDGRVVCAGPTAASRERVACMPLPRIRSVPLVRPLLLIAAVFFASIVGVGDRHRLRECGATSTRACCRACRSRRSERRARSQRPIPGGVRARRRAVRLGVQRARRWRCQRRSRSALHARAARRPPRARRMVQPRRPYASPAPTPAAASNATSSRSRMAPAPPRSTSTAIRSARASSASSSNGTRHTSLRPAQSSGWPKR